VYQAAEILANHQQHSGTQVRERYLAHVCQMQEQKAALEPLGEATRAFLSHHRELRSWPLSLLWRWGITADQQRFGTLRMAVARIHERRATGRRGAIPGVVVRGSVRVMTAVVTKEQTFSAEELRPSDYQRWHELRVHVQYREEARRQQFRFRKNPVAYLAALEAQLLTWSLPLSVFFTWP
jgi:hypothetical protein